MNKGCFMAKNNQNHYAESVLTVIAKTEENAGQKADQSWIHQLRKQAGITITTTPQLRTPEQSNKMHSLNWGDDSILAEKI